MLSAFISAFKTPDLRKKLLFTVAMVAVYRLGATVPSPGVSYSNVQACLKAANGDPNNGVLTLLNLFSGGALLQLSVFALGIMPYITASIILQLLTVVIPRLESLRKEGQSGQTKITQYTRYLTLGLGILQASAFVALARSGTLLGGRCGTSDASGLRVIPDIKGLPTPLTLSVLVITMTAGTGVIMWLGEMITDRGIGNGMSILIFTSIAARLPNEGNTIRTSSGWGIFTLVLLIGVVVITAVIFMEQAQRRIPVQYAKRMVGRRMYGGTSTYIPLKVNQAGVIPVIFASSLLYLPQLVVNLFPNSNNWTTRFIANHVIKQSDWVNISLYFVLILFFTYFYVSITFNPTQVADDMRKYGGFVQGVRPGKPTAQYFDFILSRITLPGALYLGIIAVLPNLFINLVGGNRQNFPFGGTAVLIIVGVALDTVKQIESQLMQRNYEGFLR